MGQGFVDDYIDVAARIAEFRSRHPEGSIQPANLEQPFQIINIDGQTFIVYGAAAYRTPDDPRPGIGYAYEPFPGRTGFTRNSELQNAETSAWGRAIVAALAADAKKGVASAEEVRNRAAERGEYPVTDHAWYQQAVARVPTASAEDVDAIEREAIARYRGGQMTQADAEELRRMINDRRAALATTVTERDGSDA